MRQVIRSAHARQRPVDNIAGHEPDAFRQRPPSGGFPWVFVCHRLALRARVRNAARSASLTRIARPTRCTASLRKRICRRRWLTENPVMSWISARVQSRSAAGVGPAGLGEEGVKLGSPLGWSPGDQESAGQRVNKGRDGGGGSGLPPGATSAGRERQAGSGRARRRRGRRRRHRRRSAPDDRAAPSGAWSGGSGRTWRQTSPERAGPGGLPGTREPMPLLRAPAQHRRSRLFRCVRRAQPSAASSAWENASRAADTARPRTNRRSAGWMPKDPPPPVVGAVPVRSGVVLGDVLALEKPAALGNPRMRPPQRGSPNSGQHPLLQESPEIRRVQTAEPIVVCRRAGAPGDRNAALQRGLSALAGRAAGA